MKEINKHLLEIQLLFIGSFSIIIGYTYKHGTLLGKFIEQEVRNWSTPATYFGFLVIISSTLVFFIRQSKLPKLIAVVSVLPIIVINLLPLFLWIILSPNPMVSDSGVKQPISVQLFYIHAHSLLILLSVLVIPTVNRMLKRSNNK